METAIKKYRKRMNLTQQKISKILKITQPSYSIIEREGIKKCDTARKYAILLGCKPSELMDLD